MKSRISFFDKTLLRKDITRFAPVWIIYLVGGLLVGFGMVRGYTQEGYAAATMAETIGVLAIVNLIYALVCAECLFGDLFNSRMCNALHSLPLRREQLFATHVIAGLLFSFVPNTAISLIMMTQLGNLWFVALLWLLGMMLEFLFFFSIASVCAVSTGSRFAMGAVYTLINFLSEVLHWFVITFYEPMLPGLHIRTDGFDRFCPTVWLSSAAELVRFEHIYDKVYDNYISAKMICKGLTGDWWYLAVLGVLGLALLGLGVLLYRKRRLESAGDFLVFRPMVPVCSVIFTLSVAAVFQILGQEIGIATASLVVGFIVGCFGTEMLLRRTVKVFDKKTFIKCAAIGGAFALTLLLTVLDPMGLTRWTPDPEKVESVTLSDDFSYDPEYESDYGYISSMTITDPERIAELVQIHESLLEQREPIQGDFYDYYYQYYDQLGAIHLTYQMSNGTQVERRYYYRMDSAIGEQIGRFYQAPEFILGYQDWDTYLDMVGSVMVEFKTDEYRYQEYYGPEAVSLLEAIKADCEAGTIDADDYYAEAEYYVSVETRMWKNIGITSDCANTMAWLKDHL